MDLTNLKKLIADSWQRYHFKLGSKQIYPPYRINIPYQEDRKKYGKSSPEELLNTLKETANTQNFNLDQKSETEIRQFMKEHMLGIDCSGFVYHTLDQVLQKLGFGGMEKIGLPKASSTNVKVFRDNKLTAPVVSLSDIKPGDFICLQKGSDEDIAHIMLITDKTDNNITYVQSTEKSEPRGVQTKIIKIVDPLAGLEKQEWEERLTNGKLRSDYFNPKTDGVRRLNIFL